MFQAKLEVDNTRDKSLTTQETIFRQTRTKVRQYKIKAK